MARRRDTRTNAAREAVRLLNGVHSMRGPLLPANRSRPLPRSLGAWTGFYVIVAAHEIERRYSHIIQTAGVSLRDFVLMAEVADVPGISQGGLSWRLGLGKSRVSEQLMVLDHAGFLGRSIDQRDLRRRHVWLSHEGTQAVEDIRDLVTRVDRGWLSPLHPEERPLLRKMLRRLSPNVADA